jgi:UTP--glucose-1-phosphate uridylyltransferase
MSSRIRKVVIPAAGLGTRFLPATRVVPKELLPVAGKPLIQYAVEEAVASGLETVILVLSRSKGLIAEHFRRNLPLETILSQRGQNEDVELIRRLSNSTEIRTVWQEQPLGLADAIRCAQLLMGDEPFAVILPDALIDSAKPCIAQLLACHEKHSGCMVATQAVGDSEVERFGILDVASTPDPGCDERTMRVTSLTERPQPGTTASRHGIFGRYILEPEIFAAIEQTRPALGGELQLTDSLSLCCGPVPLYAYRFEGRHYDCGSPLGFLEATIAYALRDPEMAGPLRAHFATQEHAAFQSTY